MKILYENGHRAEIGAIGPDGGIDINIYKFNELVQVAQCKAQKKPIRIDTVRAFRWAMHKKKVEKGIFFVSHTLTKPAEKFCKKENIQPVSGIKLYEMIKLLPINIQNEMLTEILERDYKTPTCVNCRIKMVKRAYRKTGKEFWGCKNYPKCKMKIFIRKQS